MEFQIKIERSEVIWRQVADHIRKNIVSGRLPAGAKLPSTAALSHQVGTDSKTVHRALTHLVREGLITRARKVGTHVTDRNRTLTRIGLYHSTNIMTTQNALYVRALQMAIQTIAEKAGMSLQVWVDQRPEEEQTQTLPSLQEAVRNGTIQAVISTATDPERLHWLKKLTVPVVSQGTSNSLRVEFDMASFWDISLAALKEQGCKTTGIITPYHLSDKESHQPFLEACRRHGIAVKDQWIIERQFDLLSFKEEYYEKFGYDCFHALWAKKPKPDGLIVFPDSMARGVILAMMELHVRVPEDLCVVLHKNEEIDIFCPLPVTHIGGSVSDVARGLIGQLEKFIEGTIPTPLFIPSQRFTASGAHSPTLE